MLFFIVGIPCAQASGPAGLYSIAKRFYLTFGLLFSKADTVYDSPSGLLLIEANPRIGKIAMKKLTVIFVTAGLILLNTSPLWAGGIDSKTNWSAEYIRTLNRNAATDGADIAAYNPAGIIKMENGLYGNFSVQYIDKKYTHAINSTDYNSHEPSFVPSFFAIYKQDRYAIFGGFTITGGGGYVDYANGNYTTMVGGALLNSNLLFPTFGVVAPINEQRIEAESFYYGYTIGAAYKINEIFSVSLGVRFSDAHREAQAHVIMGQTGAMPADNTHYLDYEEDADGWCGIASVNISPSKELNIGMRYESRTKLDFHQTVNQDENNFNAALKMGPSLGVNHGADVRRDLPPLLAMGISYQWTPKIRVESNLTFYLNKSAGWEDTAPTARDPGDVKNGYDFGVMVAYAFNEKLKGSLGYLFTETGIEAANMLPESPELDAQTIGGGIAYMALPGMTLNFSIGNAFYQNASFVSNYTGGSVEYDKNNFFFAFGVEYKFF